MRPPLPSETTRGSVAGQPSEPSRRTRRGVATERDSDDDDDIRSSGRHGGGGVGSGGTGVPSSLLALRATPTAPRVPHREWGGASGSDGLRRPGGTGSGRARGSGSSSSSSGSSSSSEDESLAVAQHARRLSRRLADAAVHHASGGGASDTRPRRAAVAAVAPAAYAEGGGDGVEDGVVPHHRRPVSGRPAARRQRRTQEAREGTSTRAGSGGGGSGSDSGSDGDKEPAAPRTGATLCVYAGPPFDVHSGAVLGAMQRDREYWSAAPDFALPQLPAPPPPPDGGEHSIPSPPAVPLPDCAICQDSVPREDRGYLPWCPHTFHAACILQWAAVTNQCPLCRVHFRSVARLAPAPLHTPRLLGCTPAAVSPPTPALTHYLSPSAVVERGTHAAFAAPGRVVHVHVAVVEEVAVARRRQVYEATEEDLAAQGYSLADMESACIICGSDEREDLLLLCDGRCGTAAHTYCVGLLAVPEGDWFCATCARAAAAAAPPLAAATPTSFRPDESSARTLRSSAVGAVPVAQQHGGSPATAALSLVSLAGTSSSVARTATVTPAGSGARTRMPSGSGGPGSDAYPLRSRGSGAYAGQLAALLAATPRGGSGGGPSRRLHLGGQAHVRTRAAVRANAAIRANLRLHGRDPGHGAVASVAELLAEVQRRPVVGAAGRLHWEGPPSAPPSAPPLPAPAAPTPYTLLPPPLPPRPRAPSPPRPALPTASSLAQLTAATPSPLLPAVPRREAVGSKRGRGDAAGVAVDGLALAAVKAALHRMEVERGAALDRDTFKAAARSALHLLAGSAAGGTPLDAIAAAGRALAALAK